MFFRLQNSETANRRRKMANRILARLAIIPLTPAKPSRAARIAMIKKAGDQLVIETPFSVRFVGRRESVFHFHSEWLALEPFQDSQSSAYRRVALFDLILGFHKDPRFVN
jgi:hypothetical protein